MRMVHLQEIAELIRGVSYEGGEASSVERPGFAAILRAGNIGDRLRLDEDLVWVPEGRVGSKQRLRVGDIVVCLSSGSGKVVGKTAILEHAFVGSIGAFCGVIRSFESIDPAYLSAWLRSPDYWAWRDRQSRGVGIQNLRLAELAKLEVPLPPIEAQRRIAQRLSHVMSHVSAALNESRERMKSIQDLRRRTYDLAFQSFVPLRIDGNHGYTPDGWQWAHLTDLARLESGHTPSRRRADWWGGTIPWIALPDIRNFDGVVASETLEMTNAEGIAHSAARVLPAETVVMSRTASVGFVTRMGRPMATSQDFVNWVCGPNLDPEFLMHLLIRSREYIRGLASGAIHKTVYFPRVKAFQVCVPPIDDQHQIVADLRGRLAVIDRMKNAVETELDAIQRLPAALLRRAFADIAA